jgi:hypothetical protein
MNRSSTDRANISEGQAKLRQVLDCGGPLPLFGNAPKSAGGPAHSKTLARRNTRHALDGLNPFKMPANSRFEQMGNSFCMNLRIHR